MLAARQVCSLPRKVLMVTLVFRSTEPALDVKHWMFRKYYQGKLKEFNVKVMPQVKYGQITPKGVNLTNKEGKEVFLEADISY